VNSTLLGVVVRSQRPRAPHSRSPTFTERQLLSPSAFRRSWRSRRKTRNILDSKNRRAAIVATRRTMAAVSTAAPRSSSTTGKIASAPAPRACHFLRRKRSNSIRLCVNSGFIDIDLAPVARGSTTTSQKINRIPRGNANPLGHLRRCNSHRSGACVRISVDVARSFRLKWRICFGACGARITGDVLQPIRQMWRTL